MQIFRDMWDCVKQQFLELSTFWQFALVCTMIFCVIALGMIFHQ